MLSDINLKAGYTTDEDNIVEDFYNPCLSEAISYDRVSGYFSSKYLKYLSKGIENLIQNDGRYRLIISNEISYEDFFAIKEGYYNREKIIKYVDGLFDFDVFSTFDDKKKLANLAYLITIGLVDVKIGFSHSGLFHAKFGLISDKSGNKIYFSGSANETANAIKYNFENIDIKKSWLHKSEKDYVINRQKYFNDLWDGTHKNSMIYISEINDRLKFKISEHSIGRIVIEKEYFERNSLILVFNNNRLEIINNLNEDIVDTRYFERLVRKHKLDRESYYFNKEVSFRDIEDIIKILENHKEKSKQKIIIAESVYEFIENSKFEINEIAKRGLLIKNQDESLAGLVAEFNSIVDQEFTEGYSLRGVQKWVSYFMTRMKRAANFSVPGSGKTAMVYGSFAYLSSPSIDEIDQIVMIGPKNSFLSWKDEFKMFFGKNRKLNVLDIHNPSFDEKQFIISPHSYNLILVNYESLPKHYDNLKRFVNHRTMLVFDEVHKIKNTESIRAKNAIDIARLSKFRFVLTGTPIPNSYLDIWNFLHILYDSEYNDYFGLSKSELSSTDSVIKNKANDKLSPFFWRVTKEDLNVPPAEEDYVYKLEANDKEQKVLDILWKKYRHNPFKLYIRLIQFSSNPQLLSRNIEKSMFYDSFSENDSEIEDLLFEFDNLMIDNITNTYTDDELNLIKEIETTVKFEACINKIEDLVNQNKQVIVWCIFVNTIDKVVKRCEEKGFNVRFINGRIKSDEREKIIKDFQANKFDVLVTNPHTLAESVSLHKTCHDAIYLEYSFNLTHMLQSRDRIHRFGLKPEDKTSYYYFMLEGQDGERNTIDQKIYDRLKQKANTMYEAIEGELLVPEYTDNEKEEILEMMNEEIKKLD